MQDVCSMHGERSHPGWLPACRFCLTMALPHQRAGLRTSTLQSTRMPERR